MVSVLLITYNHSKFIEECLESILMQKTTFPFEILIGEDDSQDGTREICKKYAEKYANKIQLFLRSRSDVKRLFGKPTGMHNFQETLKAAKGKYVALCEGDDYWTDPLKLQKQVDLLEANPQYTGCFTDACIVNQEGEVTVENQFVSKQTTYNSYECLTITKASYATCTLLWKKSVFEGEWPNWFKQRSCDQFIELMIARKGLLAHLPEHTGAYRMHEGGIWIGSSELWRNKDLVFRYSLLINSADFDAKAKEYLIKKLIFAVAKVIHSNEITVADAQSFYKEFSTPLVPKLKEVLKIINDQDEKIKKDKATLKENKWMLEGNRKSLANYEKVLKGYQESMQIQGDSLIWHQKELEKHDSISFLIRKIGNLLITKILNLK